MFGYQFINEIEAIQKQMEQVFSEFNPVRDAQGQALAVKENDQEYIVTAVLPGLDVEKLDISILGRSLTVSGGLVEDDIPEQARWYRQERGQGRFERTLQLAKELDADQVEAEYQSGILKIRLPKAASAQPKKIAVNIND